MKSGFIILFLEIFGVQLCNFLLSVKSEIAYIFLLIQSFLLLFIYRHLYLLVKQSLKNAQQEAEFQSLRNRNSFLFPDVRKRWHSSRPRSRISRHFRLI